MPQGPRSHKGHKLPHSQRKRGKTRTIDTRMVTPPKPIKTIPAIYPPLGYADPPGVTVSVSVVVSTKGEVTCAAIKTSGGPLFNEAALAAARQWRFSPALYKGKPIAVKITLPFRFPPRVRPRALNPRGATPPPKEKPQKQEKKTGPEERDRGAKGHEKVTTTRDEAKTKKEDGVETKKRDGAKAQKNGGAKTQKENRAKAQKNDASCNHAPLLHHQRAQGRGSGKKAPHSGKENPKTASSLRGGEERTGREEILVTGRLKRPKKTAISEFKLTRAILTAAPQPSASDMLRTAPGFYIGHPQGEGVANALFLRGFDAEHGQDFELWAGEVPINLPGHIHAQGYADMHFLIPETVSSLTVTEGVFQASQGDFAVAGSGFFHYGVAKRGLHLGLTLGSFDTRRLLLLWAPKGQSRET
ncbi:MAG: hypothetical protein CSA75_05350, partial [Sorangium cellulosum]